MGFDIAEMEASHSKYWMDLGLCSDGNHYGIPWFPNFKSIVFYHEPTFTENGYEVPETYEDLVALSQQIVDDGMTPWCFGWEAADATGWAGDRLPRGHLRPPERVGGLQPVVRARDPLRRPDRGRRVRHLR